MKHLLQRVAVRTQFPPFVWLYRALYWLAIRYAARQLRRIRGVRSIYLRRGLVSARPIYGLSDIDLLVLIDSEDSKRTEARVLHRYAMLCRLIPMLPQNELLVRTPENLRQMCEHSAFFRGRFAQMHDCSRKLWGEDLLACLPKLTRSEAQSLAAEELMPAWYQLCQELLPDDRRPTFVRRHVAYKWIAEAARAVLVTEGADPAITRDDAIEHAVTAYPEIAEAIEEIRRWPDRLLTSEPIPVDRVIDTFFVLAERTFAAQGLDSLTRRRLRVRAACMEDVQAALGPEAIERLAAACSQVSGIERAVLVPRLSVDPLAFLDLFPRSLAGATIDAYDLVIAAPHRPPAEALRRLGEAIAPFRPRVNGFYSDGRLAVALRPTFGWSVKHHRRDPAFFESLRTATPLTGKLLVAGVAEGDFFFQSQQPLALRAQTLLSLFRDAEVFQMPTDSFLRLFWEAGRAALLAAQDARTVLEAPVTSGQVLDALAELTPQHAPILRMIHEQYVRELTGDRSDIARYALWLSRYASRLQQVVFADAAGDEIELPTNPRTELTIAVVIVTRNRSALLRRALESLVRQPRQADQVVVVDNASTDDTAAIARSFQDRLPITVISEPRIGIPHARNTGIEHCTGDVVAFMDDDCVADPGWLAALEEPFLKDPFVGAVGGSIVSIGGQPGLVTRFYDSRMELPTPRKEAARA